jgi:hypothetical protein|tara:strand:- start:554 stop:763 length:210 start_codon:yes stop_codon:yes gene_type:complete
MGKVKQAVQEVQEEIQEIVYEFKGEIALEDVKTTLKNKFFFKQKDNPYYINVSTVEECYKKAMEEYNEA